MTRKQKRGVFIGFIFAAAALGVFAVLASLNSAIAYFYTPSDLQKLAKPPAGVIRLGGLVKQGSVAYPGGSTTVQFVVADKFAQTRVTYNGILPDLFREGQGVVVEGKLEPDGSVEASQVLAKHDEKYMPKELADALKKQGVWQEKNAPHS
ncbi:MAG: cytochrome c maturation protein CcmE [Alphaproteobacteria bacterium]|nr:cytochrome c maturation protein CcmE [Alphaproteobacteria bacterium]